jgi:nicotinamidase-related amidase
MPTPHPTKTALIVVDAQIGVIANAWNAERIIDNIAHAVQRARTQNIPIIWVQHQDDELPPNSPNWHLVPPLTAADTEIRIDKHYNSAFEQTNLHQTLTTLGINHIALAGAATNWCIRATAYGALERNYNLTLIADAHTTKALELENGRTIEAEQIIEELNITMNWVNYPNRTNTTATTAHLDFTAPTQ